MELCACFDHGTRLDHDPCDELEPPRRSAEGAAIKDGMRGMVEFRGTLKLANSTLLSALTSNTMTALAVFIRTG